ncbi:metal-dependent transcriptional regulator [uncultured Gordonia sp.]|uniref:metal-dependent transcriptional regulator n=1 Tax=uncultured Gordonia sp. TaxID=198437 RepID=UPI0025923612|nr:metal-dependent transcriptional regulator [uncultured Gordonia sp.]
MNRLINTASCYVRTIYSLSEDGLIPKRVRLVERLGQAGATVSQTVERLKRDGLLTDAPEQRLELTDKGNRVAVAVTRKHRLAERMLTDILGLPSQHVHEEAARWQHVMSEDAERGIVRQLDDPTESPWGNPIPGLDELGVSLRPRPPGIRLLDIKNGEDAFYGSIQSISEDAQDDANLMSELISAGVIPGARVRVEYQSGVYIVRGLNTINIPAKCAHIVQLERTRQD